MDILNIISKAKVICASMPSSDNPDQERGEHEKAALVIDDCPQPEQKQER